MRNLVKLNKGIRILLQKEFTVHEVQQAKVKICILHADKTIHQ